MTDAKEVELKSVTPIKEDAEKGTSKLDPPGDAPYDPHEHRRLSHGTTNNETLIHILKGSMGTGILAMPQAFNNGGIILSTISTVVIGFLCTYCLHVLVNAQYILCKRKKVPLLTYPDSMKYALEEGPPILRPLAAASPLIVDGFMISYQLGICCVYIVFVAENIRQVATYYWMDLDVRIWMLILLLPLILINSIRNLKVLAPFSQAANIVTFIGIGIVMYYVFQDLPSLSTRKYVGEPKDYVLFIGTTLFALEAVGVVIAVENNMLTPKSFGSVLDKGMVGIVLLYIFVGFFGCLKYGPLSEGSITINIPPDELLAHSVNIIFSFAIYITYALQCYVPVDIIWNTYLKKRLENSERKLLIEYLMRAGVVIVTFLLAVAIPRLGLFISLFGALCLSALGISFPALMELCVKYPDNLGPYKMVMWKDIFLFICGILGLVFGTVASVHDIIVSYQ